MVMDYDLIMGGKGLIYLGYCGILSESDILWVMGGFVDFEAMVSQCFFVVKLFYFFYWLLIL